MDKIDLEKNCLDLAYKRNLQLMNIFLIIGFGSIIAYLTGFFLDSTKRFQYSVLFTIVGILTYVLYLNINDNLKTISNKIANLIR